MKELKLGCLLLLYLDRRRFLENMRNKCDSFLNEYSEKSGNKFPPLRQLLELDVMDLLNNFPELGDFLINEPLGFQQMCNEILFACVKSNANDDKQYVDAMQVAVIVRLKHFHPILSYPRQQNYRGFNIFTGLLLDISKPHSYVIHTVWSCPEECEGNEVILHQIPRAPPKCYVCRSILFENSGLRRCGEQVVATFLTSDYSHPIKVVITDDLISKLKIGIRFIVHAVVLKNKKTVWSIEEVISPFAALTYPVPGDIEQIFRACNGVSWMFIYWLASTIGVRKCPLQCFIHAKINLLLSIVSVKANSAIGSPIINVLVTGNETKYIGDLINEATVYVDNSVHLGNSHNSVNLTLIASSGGVCILPLPMHLYNQKQIGLILKFLENGTVATENGEVDVRCAVWAHSNNLKRIGVKNLSSVFGTVCRGDYGEQADDLVEYMLQKARGTVSQTIDERSAVRDLTEYINLVAGINVSLDKSSENLLKAYFIAARKETVSVAPIGSIGALVSVCLTSARLCHRGVTNVDDAIFAIWLHVCGSLEPRAAPEDYLQTPPCTEKLAENMSHFKNWLEQFTGSVL